MVFAYGHVTPEFGGWDADRREPGRQYIKLDGIWAFRYDSENVGQRDGWFGSGVDDSDWDSVSVPSPWDLLDNDGWDTYDPADFGKGGSLKNGYAWYRTSVAVPSNWQGMFSRLNFLGVFYSADIWVDGTWVGKHEGGHTSFAIPMAEVLRPGRDAVLAIRVYRRPATPPTTEPVRWSRTSTRSRAAGPTTGPTLASPDRSGSRPFPP